VNGLFATDSQAGIAWFALSIIFVGGIGVFVALAVIVVRSKLSPPRDDELDGHGT
jgi:hypothetical protein